MSPGSGNSSSCSSALNSSAWVPQPVEPTDRGAGHHRVVVGQTEFQVVGQAGVGQVGGSDQRGPGIVGVAEQVGLAVQEPFNKPPHLHLGPPQPRIEVRELGGPRRWEPSQVPILAQPLKRPLEMWQRRGRTQTGSRSRS